LERYLFLGFTPFPFPFAIYHATAIVIRSLGAADRPTTAHGQVAVVLNNLQVLLLLIEWRNDGHKRVHRTWIDLHLDLDVSVELVVQLNVL
jgi:hypothetical protein